MSDTLPELSNRYSAGTAIRVLLGGGDSSSLTGPEKEYCQERERETQESRGGIRVPVAALNREFTTAAGSGGALIQQQSPMSAGQLSH